VDGLLFDESGRKRTTQWAVKRLPGILGSIEVQAAELDRLGFLLGNDRLATGDNSDDYALRSAATNHVNKFEPEVRTKWTKSQTCSPRKRHSE
jgi:hypothetical protein